MTYATAVLIPLADNDSFGHMDFGGGWWIVMGLGMILFWGLVILGIVWLVQETSGHREQSARNNDPIAILDRRLAEGTISPEEYRQRRTALTGAPPPARSEGK